MQKMFTKKTKIVQKGPVSIEDARNAKKVDLSAVSVATVNGRKKNIVGINKPKN